MMLRPAGLVVFNVQFRVLQISANPAPEGPASPAAGAGGAAGGAVGGPAPAAPGAAAAAPAPRDEDPSRRFLGESCWPSGNT